MDSSFSILKVYVYLRAKVFKYFFNRSKPFYQLWLDGVICC